MKLTTEIKDWIYDNIWYYDDALDSSGCYYAMKHDIKIELNIDIDTELFDYICDIWDNHFKV